jgi:hypothetical protein
MLNNINGAFSNYFGKFILFKYIIIILYSILITIIYIIFALNTRSTKTTMQIITIQKQPYCLKRITL